MDLNTSRRLEKFFTTFNVTELGEGDPVVGVNTLAVMCCALAAVARPGSGIVTNNGKLLRLGTSMLVSGSASAGRVMDEVLLEVGLRQNHFTQHLQRHLQWKEQSRRQPLNCTVVGKPLDRNPEIFQSELPGNDGMFLGPGTDEWELMLARPPIEGLDPLAGGLKFFIAATRPKDLEKRLSSLRRGQPLVHLAVTKPADLAGFGETVGDLLDGCLPGGTNGETVRGQVLVTDPLNVLNEAARNPDDGLAWVGRVVWLCDHSTGPEVSKDPGWMDMDPADSLSGRFREALGRGLAKRLDGDIMQPQINKADLAAAQHRWTDFLKEMDRSLPGISGAARNLLTTLSFGLLELAHSAPPRQTPAASAKKLNLTIDDVEAFARFLVLRMANARATMLYSAEVSRRESNIRRVFQKIGDLPIEVRKVYQHLNLKADDCHECLRWLEESGLAIRSGSSWKRVEGAELSFTGRPILTLEA